MYVHSNKDIIAFLGFLWLIKFKFDAKIIKILSLKNLGLVWVYTLNAAKPDS